MERIISDLENGNLWTRINLKDFERQPFGGRKDAGDGGGVKA